MKYSLVKYRRQEPVPLVSSQFPFSLFPTRVSWDCIFKFLSLFMVRIYHLSLCFLLFLSVNHFLWKQERTGGWSRPKKKPRLKLNSTACRGRRSSRPRKLRWVQWIFIIALVSWGFLPLLSPLGPQNSQHSSAILILVKIWKLGYWIRRLNPSGWLVFNIWILVFT